MRQPIRVKVRHYCDGLATWKCPCQSGGWMPAGHVGAVAHDHALECPALASLNKAVICTNCERYGKVANACPRLPRQGVDPMRRPEIRDYVTIDGFVIGYIAQEQPGRWRSYYDWHLADHATWWQTREQARRNLIDRFRHSQALPPLRVHR